MNILEIKEKDMFEIRNSAGEVVATETDFGNAAELEMVLSEMNPNEKFTIVEALSNGWEVSKGS